MRFTIVVAICCLVATPRAHGSDRQTDLVLRVQLDDQAITPITARFVERAIRHAGVRGARYLIIELDTPGGVVDATRDMVRAVLASPTDVVVYVAPAGARAASAGLFVTLASHVAAMAPGTHIGAAHPVRIGGLPGAPGDSERERNGKDVLGEKAVNDTQAWARSLAELRGRNVELAERAVSESRSVTATEAVAAGLVDFVAADFAELLDRLGVPGAAVEMFELGWGQRLLAALASPNLAFILLIFGFYGIVFEFYSGGFGVAGVLGLICILLAFVGLAVLPISYVGLALIVLGMALFVAEGFVVSFGLLTAGGVVCVSLGGLMLIDSPPGFVRVSTVVVLPVAAAAAAVAVFVLGSAIRVRRSPVKTGFRALAEGGAVAQEAFRPVDGHYQGTVLAHGEFWNAVSPSPVSAHDVVSIEQRDGLLLTVEPEHPAKERNHE